MHTIPKSLSSNESSSFEAIIGIIGISPYGVPIKWQNYVGSTIDNVNVVSISLKGHIHVAQ